MGDTEPESTTPTSQPESTELVTLDGDNQETDLGHRLIEIENRSKRLAGHEAGIVTDVEPADADTWDDAETVEIRFERANTETYTDDFTIPGYCPPADETPIHELENDLLRFCRSEEIPYTLSSFAGDALEGEPVPIVETDHDDYTIWIPDPEPPEPPTPPLHERIITTLSAFGFLDTVYIATGALVSLVGLLAMVLLLTAVIGPW